MKVKLIQLVNAQEALKEFLAQKVPAATGFKLAKLVRLVEPELKDYERARLELFKKHGDTKDEQITLRPEESDAFAKEMSDLLDTEVEFTIGKLGFHEVSSALISGQMWLTLDWLLEPPDETK